MRRPFTILFLALLAAGCAERRPTTAGEEEGISPGEVLPIPAIFPHSEDWQDPTSHGAWVIQNGLIPCLNCHQRVAAVEGPTPTCGSCHPLFPHTEGWTLPENHGATVLRTGRGSCATRCHGTDLNGGLSGVSCTLCHAIYPHTPTWLGPTQHGETAKGNGKLLCQGCHGEDLEGGQSGVGCRECHPIYPHESGWASREEHGGYVTEQGQGGCATQCHGLNLQGGLSGISCNSCHNLYPHPSQWEQNHGTTASSLGLGACQGCHGADYTTLLDGKNCYTCHPSYPHETATSAPWGQFEGHGQYTLSNSKGQCQSCHGTNYQGGPRGNPTCFNASCHASYPHLEGWRRNPGEPQEHGNYVNANSTSSCATERCHGVGLVPTVGVTQGPSCSGCHETYPHPTGWISGGLHGPVARADITKCKTCHEPTLDAAPPGYQGCKGCHESYLQHETAQMGVVGWETPAGHGNYVNTTLSGNETACKLCHGSDLTGGVSGVSCFTCHPGWPHDAIAGWNGAPHGTLAVDLTVRETCKDCHGLDLLGGPAGISCWGCHTNFPHAADWLAYQVVEVEESVCCSWGDWDEECWEWCPVIVPYTRMYLHGEEFLTQKVAGFPDTPNRCSNCHGTQYDEGSPIQSCAGCHPSYPHVKFADWVTPPTVGSHGPAFLAGPHDAVALLLDLDGISGDVVSCALCHKNLGQGLAPVSEALVGERADACISCHPGQSYPHFRVVVPPPTVNPDSWIYRAGSHAWQYKHGYRFIIDSIWEDSGTPNPCKECHGADLHGEGSVEKNCSQPGCHSPPPREIPHGIPNWQPAAGHGKNYLAARIAGIAITEAGDSSTVPDDCHDCHPATSNRNPKVCNPFLAEFPASATGWCNTCHKPPLAPVVCPCPGMNPTTGACP